MGRQSPTAAAAKRAPLTEAQRDSAMNAGISHATAGWNSGKEPDPIAGTGVLKAVVGTAKKVGTYLRKGFTGK